MNDDMKIEDGIKYCKSTGEMTGYVDMGKLNISEQTKEHCEGTHVQVFMICDTLSGDHHLHKISYRLSAVFYDTGGDELPGEAYVES